MDFTKYHIRYWCDLNPGTGFNNAARGYLAALRVLGLTSEHVHVTAAVNANFGVLDNDLSDWVYPYLHRVSADDIVCDGKLRDDAPDPWDNTNEKINIVHLSPGLIAAGGYCTFLDGRYNIAITAWETDRLQQRKLNCSIRGKEVDGHWISEQRTVVEAFNDYDEIWVPTRWNQEMMKRCGVIKPVHVVPHALLPELLKTPTTPAPATARFYTFGTWNERKDPEMLLRTYLRTGWTPLDPVDLQIYSLPPTRERAVIMGHQMLAEQAREALLESLADPTGAPPHGLHTARYEPYEMIVARHASNNVFVSTSHGEGFCLPALEAAAMGNWIIGGGPWMEELAEVAGRAEDGGLVDLLPVRAVPVTPVRGAAGYEVDQNWWTVSPRDLLAALQSARAGIEEAPLARNSEAAERVRKSYAPSSIARVIQARLEEAHAVLDGSGW